MASITGGWGWKGDIMRRRAGQAAGASSVSGSAEPGLTWALFTPDSLCVTGGETEARRIEEGQLHLHGLAQ